MVWPAQQTAPLALTPQQLHHRCEPGQFQFETTQELVGLTELIGQTRAMDAVRFGAGIQQDGYNQLPDEEKNGSRRPLPNCSRAWKRSSTRFPSG